ncbi:hypothetical protein DMC47_20480 [Nostoc sp. 3335mG]|nr:hypothetical protein DMC47_20480 [Nostoc sp. 3335mG]
MRGIRQGVRGMKGPVAIVATAGAIGIAGMSTAAQAQENKFDLSVAVVETYDSNILRFSEQRTDGPTDNLSLAPRVMLDYNRRFARQRLFANGYAGYVWNDRYQFLNRQDIALTGGAELRAGPRCRATPTASFFQAQSDLEDLGALVRNVATTQDYRVAVSCPRPAGFYPVGSVNYFRVDNSEIRRERDQSIREGRIGIAYARPSLGDAQVFANFAAIRRQRRIVTPDGPTQDVTQVNSFGMRLSRDVGTRIEAAAEIAYTTADPQIEQIPSFAGVTYSVDMSYRPISRFVLTAGAGRAVTGRGNLGTSYVVLRQASLGARLTVSHRTSLGTRVQVAQRDYQGEDSIFAIRPRGSDTQVTASGDIRYRLAKPVSLELSGRYRQRDAENDFYDYDSFAATLTAMLRI